MLVLPSTKLYAHKTNGIRMNMDLEIPIVVKNARYWKKADVVLVQIIAQQQ